MLSRFCLAELDLVANLLNKIQFTFEVACSLLDFRPFQTNFLEVCINFGPALQEGGWVGGGEGRVGVGVEREETITPMQVKTQGHQSPSNGPDHLTRPKGHHSGQV